MPELFVELFSEEIPARMQAAAAAAMERTIAETLKPLAPNAVQTWYGPRRIALKAEIVAEVPAASTVERGPRASAPPQALEGFLRKHGATREQVTEEAGHFVLTRSSPATPAATLVAQALPGLLRRFPWPKSMRWGNGSGFVWVRPLRRITCLLDGTVVPFSLADGADDGHDLVAGDQTEGHRFHAPNAFAVHSAAAWHDGLLARHVVPDAAERRRRIADGVAQLAAAAGLAVVPDEDLLDEVAGLVEWPVPLLGHIDAAYMDLPAEVMQVSMRVNQRYFALRTTDGAPAPHFAFVANIEATDGGAAIIAGNERVLRARFSDARHFWDLDRRTKLADRVAALAGITFHAKLGTQAARVERLAALARHTAPLVGADPVLAERAARLAKADLTTGMVGEFPELQGVMGGYYAAHDGKDPAVAAAVREHYAPRGPNEAAPTAPVSIAVALADKIDQLAAFFAVGEVPTGSGDPYALRRAALGVIRIIRENGLSIKLRPLFAIAESTLISSLASNRKLMEPSRKALETCLVAIRVITPAVDVDKLSQRMPLIGAIIVSCPSYPLDGALGMMSPFDAQEKLDRAIEDLRNLTCTQLLSTRVAYGLATEDLITSYQRQFSGELTSSLLSFILDRLRTQLRAEGARYDVLGAVFAAGEDDDLVRLLARAGAVAGFLATPEGADLLAGARRAANIVRIEDKKDGPHPPIVDVTLLREPAESALAFALHTVHAAVEGAMAADMHAEAMLALASLRPMLDSFFDTVTVNDPDPALRRNRLGLLAAVGAAMALAADFSRIEG